MKMNLEELKIKSLEQLSDLIKRLNGFIVHGKEQYEACINNLLSDDDNELLNTLSLQGNVRIYDEFIKLSKRSDLDQLIDISLSNVINIGSESRLEIVLDDNTSEIIHMNGLFRKLPIRINYVPDSEFIKVDTYDDNQVLVITYNDSKLFMLYALGAVYVTDMDNQVIKAGSIINNTILLDIVKLNKF